MWEPWATLYAHGIKKIETRPKPTNYHGTYLIHAAKKWTKQQELLCMKEPFRDNLIKLGVIEFLNGKILCTNFQLGYIIGSVDIRECVQIPHLVSDSDTEMYCCMYDNFRVSFNEFSFGDYDYGRYAWIGENNRVIKDPIPYKGHQGYYHDFKGDMSKLIFK